MLHDSHTVESTVATTKLDIENQYYLLLTDELLTRLESKNATKTSWEGDRLDANGPDRRLLGYKLWTVMVLFKKRIRRILR